MLSRGGAAGTSAGGALVARPAPPGGAYRPLDRRWWRVTQKNCRSALLTEIFMF